MRRTRLPLIAALCLLAGFVHAAEKTPPSIGMVTARAGSCIVVVLNEGESVKSGDVLETHRARLLAALAQGGKRVDASGKWEATGKVRVRVLNGKRFAVGFAVQEAPRTGLTGQPVPSILPGDLLRRAKP